MKLLQIVHPAAKMMVDISLSQDAEVGDGTTSVVLLAGSFLKAAKPYIEDVVHPQIIVQVGFQNYLIWLKHTHSWILSSPFRHSAEHLSWQ